MNDKPAIKREITCEVCGRRCQTEQKGRDSCRDCHRKEPSVRCLSCGLMKHLIAVETGLCPRCTRIVARPEAECVLCGRFKVIYNQEDWLCKTCNKRKRQLSRNEGRPNKVQCSICGQMRVSVFLSKAICRTCQRVMKNGCEACAQCHRVIHDKTRRFCLKCYQDSLAPSALRNFLASFTTTYSYKNMLFDLLASTIEWESVNQKINQRFQIFGRFLQSHQFHKPLTWEIIEATVPPLEPIKHSTREILRTCLLTLGHLLAARGELESCEIFLEKRRSLASLEHAPRPSSRFFIATPRGSGSERQHHPTCSTTWSPSPPSGPGAKSRAWERQRRCRRLTSMITC